MTLLEQAELLANEWATSRSFRYHLKEPYGEGRFFPHRSEAAPGETISEARYGASNDGFIAAGAYCTNLIPKGSEYYRTRHLGDYCSERHFQLRLQGVPSHAEHLLTATHNFQQLERDNSPFRRRLTVALLACLGTGLGSVLLADMTRGTLLVTAVALLFVLLNQTISRWNSGQSAADIRRARLNVESMRWFADAEKPDTLASTSARPPTSESPGSDRP